MKSVTFILFASKMAVTLIYALLAGLVGHMHAAFVVLFVVGMVISSIVSTFMMGDTGTGRKILFYVSMFVLLIPSFVCNILVIVARTGSFFEYTFFASCTGIVFVTWLGCGEFDFACYAGDVGAILISMIYAALFWLIFLNVYKIAVILMSGCLVLLLIMLIIRIKRGSAFD